MKVESSPREPHRPTVVTDGGPWVMHDQVCSVCATRHAVYDVGTGIFLPCWTCQGEGWKLVKRRFRRGKTARRVNRVSQQVKELLNEP